MHVMYDSSIKRRFDDTTYQEKGEELPDISLMALMLK